MTLRESIAVLALAAKQNDCPCYCNSRWQDHIPVVLSGDWSADFMEAADGLTVSALVPASLADFALVVTRTGSAVRAKLTVDHIE